MTEKSLLLRPDMARTYAEGRKTQTRRMITRLRGFGKITEFGPSDTRGYDWHFRDKRMLWNEVSTQWLLNHCPYGAPGDRVRLLTTWSVHQDLDDLKPLNLPEYEGSGLHDCAPISVWSYFNSSEKPDWCGKLRPGRFLPLYRRDWMPYSELLDVSVEQVQDISEEDAINEGVLPIPGGVNYIYTSMPYKSEFATLWNMIYGPNAWERNDWVWRLKLEKGGER
jgi:hypothetical protein